ncbi:hypothetical protein [Streptomyces sp. CA-132043]|uniref:hypothetical protein n=1 Tax=Streptomyces sp. CA-132043 TaxID=3240048 RepID=UPI003D939DAE
MSTQVTPGTGALVGAGALKGRVLREGLQLAEVIPAPGYVLGILTAWVIQIPTPPRTLFQTPPMTPFRPGRSLRFPATFLLFALLGVAHSFFYGLLAGHVVLVFLAHYKTRLQLTGLLLRVVVPVLLAALAIRTLILDDRSGENLRAWVLPLALSVPTAGACWAIPYGKKLYWRGSWKFPYPRSTPPDLLQGGAASGTQTDAQQGPRYTFLLPGQYPFRGIGLWLAGWPCCLMALGLSFWGAHQLLSEPASWMSGVFLTLTPMGVYAFSRSRRLFLKGRRHLKLPLASPNVLRPGSYVLYLRSFEDDKARSTLQKQFLTSANGMPPDVMGGLIGLVTSSRDEEEHIADALRPVGSLVAVGAPDEVLPFAGAVRMYLPKNSWQEPVRDLMVRARLVTLTLGSSAGTVWELAEAMRTLPPQRLLLIVPGMMRAAEYETLRKGNETALRALPESSRNHTWKSDTLPSLPDRVADQRSLDPVAGVIHFSADWEPTFTPMPRTDFPWQNLCTGLIRTLSPAFQQLVSHEEKTGRHCG